MYSRKTVSTMMVILGSHWSTSSSRKDERLTLFDHVNSHQRPWRLSVQLNVQSPKICVDENLVRDSDIVDSFSKYHRH